MFGHMVWFTEGYYLKGKDFSLFCFRLFLFSSHLTINCVLFQAVFPQVVYKRVCRRILVFNFHYEKHYLSSRSSDESSDLFDMQAHNLTTSCKTWRKSALYWPVIVITWNNLWKLISEHTDRLPHNKEKKNRAYKAAVIHWPPLNSFCRCCSCPGWPHIQEAAS